MGKQNTDLYYLTYNGKYGYYAEIFTDYNRALEFLNDHPDDYIGSVHVSADRKSSGFSNMLDELDAFLENRASEEAYRASLHREFHPSVR